MIPTNELIARAYATYRDRVNAYIGFRVNDEETARDLTQDVFVRMLDYSQVIYENAIESFIFTIARNIVNDYLRRQYVRQEFDRYMHDYAPVADSSVEHGIIYRDLAALERSVVESLPRMRAAVYRLKRFDELPAKEIAERLGVSVRTVENHYYAGLKQMRESLANVI